MKKNHSAFLLIGAILGSPAFSAAIPTLQPVTESVMHVRINSKKLELTPLRAQMVRLFLKCSRIT